MIMKIRPEGLAITERFILVLKTLKEQKKIRGLKTFSDRYNLNYWNFTTMVYEPERRFLKPELLYYLVSDYGVNAEWLLTGRGLMFEKTT